MHIAGASNTVRPRIRQDRREIMLHPIDIHRTQVSGTIQPNSAHSFAFTWNDVPTHEKRPRYNASAASLPLYEIAYYPCAPAA